MSVLKGTNVASTIVPFTTDDMYATHDSLYGKGGYKEVATEQERDAIPETRLKEGTKVYVQDTKKEYRYVGGEWELVVYSTSPGDPSNPTSMELNDLEDVSLQNEAANQLLIYNGEKWINADVDVSNGVTIQPVNDLNDIPGVDIAEATANQVLMYDGTKWTNTDLEIPEGGTGTSPINSLDDIPDVDVAGATANQVLAYDGNKWISKDVEFSGTDTPVTPDIELDEEVTEFSDNPVKSSGIYSAINNTVNNKFVVLSESEYNSMAHDAKTFYFIKQ